MRGTGKGFVVCFGVATMRAALSCPNQEFIMGLVWKWRGRWRLRRKEVSGVPRRRKEEECDMNTIKTKKREQKQMAIDRPRARRELSRASTQNPRHDPRPMWMEQGGSQLVFEGRQPF